MPYFSNNDIFLAPNVQLRTPIADISYQQDKSIMALTRIIRDSTALSKPERGASLLEYVVLIGFFTVTVFVSTGDAGQMTREVFGRVFPFESCTLNRGGMMYGFIPSGSTIHSCAKD